MGDAKRVWNQVKFGDVVCQVKDKVDPTTAGIGRVIRGEHMDTDDLHLRRWEEVGDDYLGPAFHMRFQPGHVLYGSRRTYLRKVAMADFEGITANTTFVVGTKDPAVLLPELVPFIMTAESFHDHSVKQSKGSVNPYVNFSDLAWYEFALPPLERQAKIAEVLWASDAYTEDLRRTLSASAGARLSIRDSLTELNGMRSEPLGALCEMQNGRPFPSKQYQDDGVRLLRPGNLAPDGTMIWTDEKTVCLPKTWAKEAPDHVIHPGDVCINLTAQSLEDGFMGRVVMAREADDCLLNQRIGRFVAIDDGVRPEWLFRVLQSTRFLRHAASRCEGTKVQHLFWSHLEDFEVPLPTLADQDVKLAIMRELDDAVVTSEQRLVEHQAAHQALRESLLNPTDGGVVA